MGAEGARARTGGAGVTPEQADRLVERCDRLASENLDLLTRYNVAISQRAQALFDLNRLALGIAVKLDVPSGVPDNVHVDSLIAAVAGVLHELAKARNDAAVGETMAAENERLRADLRVARSRADSSSSAIVVITKAHEDFRNLVCARLRLVSETPDGAVVEEVGRIVSDLEALQEAYARDTRNLAQQRNLAFSERDGAEERGVVAGIAWERERPESEIRELHGPMVAKILSKMRPTLSGEVQPVVDVDPAPRAPIDPSTLDPGIRDVVVALRAMGFETTDSGDGSKPPGERVMDDPHVFIRVAPESIVSEARRLRARAPHLPYRYVKVEASYDPDNGIAVLALIYRDDTPF